MRIVEVVNHNPLWQAAFEAEAQLIQAALGETVVVIHHIGSTAIPGIYAKPIIDLLVEVKEIVHMDQHQAAMESLGYVSMGEFGIPGRRYFRKENQQGVRTHHIHAFTTGESEVERHLAFRDYMRTHQEDAQAYSTLKRELAKQYPTRIDLYMDGKDGFIKAMAQKAVQWRFQQTEEL